MSGAVPIAGLSYGTVQARFVGDVVDGGDADSLPDFVPLTGTVTFKSSVDRLLDASGRLVIVRMPITAVLDSEGYLCTPSTDASVPPRRGIDLIATDNPGLNPTGWTWEVSYSLADEASQIRPKLPMHKIAVPGGEIVDLSMAVPPAAAQPVGIPQAEAAANRAAESAEASETAASEAAASASAAEAAVVDLDAGTAANIADPDSATRAALSAQIAQELETAGVVTATLSGDPSDPDVSLFLNGVEL